MREGPTGFAGFTYRAEHSFFGIEQRLADGSDTAAGELCQLVGLSTFAVS
jgi:hypothetical protein